MFCLCCNRSTPLSASGFFAEGLMESSSDVTSALQRRAAYERRKAYSQASVSHPGQIDMIIRDVRALTMDPHIGDCAVTDIHVRDGKIVNIGRELRVTVMLEIDGRGLVALPGLIAGHRHLAGVGSLDAEQVDNADVYRILRLAFLDLMSSGVTCADHCALGIPPGLAETALLAQIDSGLRGCFSYPAEESTFDDIMSKLAERWPQEASDHRVDVRSPGGKARGECDASGDASLDAGTMAAARRLQLDSWVGSLVPGKRADLILVDPVRSRFPLGTDPAIWSAHDLDAGDVLLVCVDGRIRKRNGVIVEPNEGIIRREAEESFARMFHESTIQQAVGS